ncbi:MAG: YciI family protein [Gemmatimonadaceae bacterium]
MKYLALIYEEEKNWERMSPDEAGRMMAEYGQYTADIKSSGHYLGGNALQPTASATTVRLRAGKLATTDGPFAETKEQLGGFYLIEARDLNDAVQVASRIPAARNGSIEVRPIMET